MQKKKPTVCSYCGNSFTNRRLLLNHECKEREVQPDNLVVKSLKCLLCQNVSKNTKSLQKHLKLIHDRELFVCEKCNRIFDRKELLLEHLEKFHPIDVAVPCRRCFTKFDNHKEFVDHLNAHKNNRMRYICRICGKGFRQHLNLKLHLSVHIIFLC